MLPIIHVRPRFDPDAIIVKPTIKSRYEEAIVAFLALGVPEAVLETPSGIEQTRAGILDTARRKPEYGRVRLSAIGGTLYISDTLHGR